MDSEKVTIGAADVGSIDASQLKPNTLDERAANCEPVTRAEANQHFNAHNNLTCRGPRVHTPAEEAELKKRYDAAATLEARLAIKKELEDKFNIREADRKPAETMEEAHRATLPLIFGYADTIGQRKKTCGQSLNALIEADGKFDGEQQQVICPKCKTVHPYRVYYNVKD